MAAVIKESARVYQHVMNELADPRTAGWFLASSPWPMIAILVIYLYLVKKAGPRYMKDREAYELRKSMLVYNVIQILFSVYLVYEALMSGWWDDYSYRCQPIDFSDNPKAVRMARACWCYMICKVVELLDTVLLCYFVLRKKSNQISYLHLYHHTFMPVCSWIGVKFFAGGHGTLLGLINSFVHIIMYSYYLFAGLGPRFQKYLWWKKHLTTMQMVRFQYSLLGVDLVSTPGRSVQFAIVFVHSAQNIVFECNYPKVIVVLLCVNSIYFFSMFGSFYRRIYSKGSSTRKDS
uniref:Elongation of very long chain fatty acids protein n=1 Tax=Timema cristinae TaxID=61476 RepID=A0A7R9DAB5_TIMCR|nr:unnamed protein product [Timema cristinae]